MKSFKTGTLQENYNRLMETSTPIEATSQKYRAEVAGIGENKWSSNDIEYNTPEQAKEWLDKLSQKWFGYDLSRVVPTTVEKNQQIDVNDSEIYQNFR